MDLTTYSDADLDDLRAAILTEQERRDRVTNAPQQIAALAKEAVKSGATEADIRAALDDALDEDESS